jgi:leucyl aminopeptidase
MIFSDNRCAPPDQAFAQRFGVIMHPVFATAGKTQATPIWFVHLRNFDSVRKQFGERERAFIAAAAFEAKAGRLALLPVTDGELAGVLFGIEDPGESNIDLFRPGQLSSLLPAGTYRFANAPHDARLAALAFALGAYQFARYRKAEGRKVRLVVSEGVDGEDLSRIVEGVTLCRDLTNTPSNDMGPRELEAASRGLAKQHRAKVQVTSGDALARNFPLVHAVGAGSERAPRLIDIGWGRPGDPKITLVGKGVCFDTGGLDIKPDAGMLNMKKDMGGAATALALAHMVMARRLKIRLRVIIPAVENSISGTSFRPRDVYVSRKGISVEIGNTDAEGRLILADALTLADEDKPVLVVDFATLTGAARVALGPEVAPFFTSDDALADEISRAAAAESDPLWRMPLWEPYAAMLDSKIADLNNVATGGQGGAITAALFLRKFVAAKSWLHLDIFAWTPVGKLGRPEGAECQAARALYSLLCKRYS